MLRPFRGSPHGQEACAFRRLHHCRNPRAFERRRRLEPGVGARTVASQPGGIAGRLGEIAGSHAGTSPRADGRQRQGRGERAVGTPPGSGTSGRRVAAGLGSRFAGGLRAAGPCTFRTHRSLAGIAGRFAAARIGRSAPEPCGNWGRFFPSCSFFKRDGRRIPRACWKSSGNRAPVCKRKFPIATRVGAPASRS